MARKKAGAKSSTQYMEQAAAERLERVAVCLGITQGRVLDALLSVRTAEEIVGFVEAQQFRSNPSRAVPVLLDGAVVASMAGAITQSVSSLLGSALPDVVLAVLASQAERRPHLLAGTVEPILDRLVPMVLDRLIAEQTGLEMSER
ncbi:hypothetical protein [Pseudomonas sp. SG20052]|uniref:hypothetical protein n=1 Tax=Pseudomonas sp. SG20052 TaxID=3074147 RepID=UPI00287F570F|nr:hypothetical protein [Pseudomonas sp. SG20052]WNF54223.1 hypothetical protein RHP74_23265 [Pseudomonas sp. SG20052]